MAQEVFHTILRSPSVFGDPVDNFEFKPKSTVGIAVDTIVEYGCDQQPTLKGPTITGLNQVAFIVGSEYDVKAGIAGSKRIPCEMAGCQRALRLEIDVKFFIYLKIGLGFGIGFGTGTLGFLLKAVTESVTFTTTPFCCD